MLDVDILSDAFFIFMLNVVMLSVAFSYCYAECCYAESYYAECHYVGSRFAEYRVAILNKFTANFIINFVNFFDRNLARLPRKHK
jgi:hypothetical protein